MEFSIWIVCCLAGAYLLGSIPAAVWAGRWFFGVDVREHGSGNAGATNVYRVLGARTAIAVLLIDAAKGAAAVGIGRFAAQGFSSEEWFVVFLFLLGILALLGHVFPLFAGFRGGKGIATLAGIGIVLFPGAIVICLGVFLLVFLFTRYVSLGSILAALAFPVVVTWVGSDPLWPEVVFSILVAIFVPLTHLKNLKRLLRGQENKIAFRKDAAGRAPKP
ncbi:MAG: glycerol-3-phosphate 1-O-acyltransferase PlsY [Bacteroidales bacterium]